MKKYTNEELKEITKCHKHWLNKDCKGWEDMKANLRWADLREADLRGADLRGADLRGADLREANLREADLREADLRWANLRWADLRWADLREANLREADLRGADLREADLREANLREADLRWANLREANLREANLREADLRGADLRWADIYVPYSCPDFGMFIGFKKAKEKIIALEIPEDAKRCSATGRKCRCDKAKVLGIYDYNHNLLPDKEITSDIGNLVYRVGEVVYPDAYDDDRWNECSHGIHFFINFEEAVRYNS